jgi:hypothetical protein
MQSSQELFDACKIGKLPRLSVLVDFGMDGRDGINPITLFEKYREYSVKTLYNALVHDELYKLVGLKVKSGYLPDEMADSYVLCWE